jgi:hypothetical protein
MQEDMEELRQTFVDILQNAGWTGGMIGADTNYFLDAIRKDGATEPATVCRAAWLRCRQHNNRPALFDIMRANQDAALDYARILPLVGIAL